MQNSTFMLWKENVEADVAKRASPPLGTLRLFSRVSLGTAVHPAIVHYQEIRYCPFLGELGIFWKATSALCCRFGCIKRAEGTHWVDSSGL